MRRFVFVLAASVLVFCLAGGAEAVSLNYNEISDASKLIKNYKEQQGKIPQQTIIENKTIRADDYLYAASNTIINLNQNKRVEITYNSIQPPTKPAGTATGTLTHRNTNKTGIPTDSPEH